MISFFLNSPQGGKKEKNNYQLYINESIEMERKHVPTFWVPQHFQQDAVQTGKMALSSDHIKHTRSNCKGLVLSVCVLREQGKICLRQVSQLPGLE